jgi:hypothetical protein
MKIRIFHPSRRKRLFCCLISLLLAVGVARQVQAATTTTVQDVVYRADGQPARGTLVISWTAFTTADSLAVAAGSMSIAIGPQGAISIALVPNAGGTPDGTYYRVVYKLDDGSTSEEYWSVPATGSATIAAVRSKIVPSGVAMQVASRQYVDNAIAATVKLCTAPKPQSCVSAIASTGGTVYLAAGTYTGPITLPDNGKCVNLVGAGIDTTFLTVSAPATTVIAKGNASLPSGCRISDLTIDGNLEATYGLQLLRGKGWHIERVKIKRVLPDTGEGAVFGESSGSSAEFYEARIRNVTVAYEAGDYPTATDVPCAALCPLNGLHFLTTASDNQVSDIVAYNMTNAGIVDDAGDNQYARIHVYGFPLVLYYPNYAMEVLGNAHIVAVTADGVNTAGVHVRGNGNTITNSTFQWPSGGQVSGAFPVVADAGTDYNVYRDNVVRSGSGLNIGGVAPIFAKIGTDMFPGNNTEIAGNLNYNDPTDGGAFVAFYPVGFQVTGAVTPNAGYTFVTPFNSKATIAVRKKSGQTADLFDCFDTDGTSKLCSVDGAGNAVFASVTAPLTGNASTATALAATPTQCSTHNFAIGITASGDANCAQPAASDINGLGGAATLNVGTTSGTVAAGDDSRFNCDVTKNPCRVAATSLTGQTASIGNTTLYTASVGGQYRVVLSLWTMVAGSSGTVSFSLSANTGSGAESFGSSSLDLTKVNSGGQVSGQWNMHVGANQAISYNTTLTCSGCGSPQYGIDVVVERLQ